VQANMREDSREVHCVSITFLLSFERPVEKSPKSSRANSAHGQPGKTNSSAAEAGVYDDVLLWDLPAGAGTLHFVQSEQARVRPTKMRQPTSGAARVRPRP
jgi:hypothetical protein